MNFVREGSRAGGVVYGGIRRGFRLGIAVVNENISRLKLAATIVSKPWFQQDIINIMTTTTTTTAPALETQTTVPCILGIFFPEKRWDAPVKQPRDSPRVSYIPDDNPYRHLRVPVPFSHLKEHAFRVAFFQTKVKAHGMQGHFGEGCTVFDIMIIIGDHF